MNDINSTNFTILEIFEYASVIKCLPMQWKESTYTQNVYDFLSFNVQQKRHRNENELQCSIQENYQRKN